MVTSPCKDCVDRHCACSDSCSKFKKYREEFEAQKKWLKESRYCFTSMHNKPFNNIGKNLRERKGYTKVFGQS